VDVSLSEEEGLVAETVATLAERIGPSTTRELDDDRYTEGWRLLAETGFLGLRVPEAAGGAGASSVDVMLVAEGLGRRLCPVPYLGVIFSTGLLAGAGAAPEILGGIASGRLRVPVALDSTLRRVARSGEPGAVAWDAQGADAFLMADGDGGLVTVAAEGSVLDAVDLTRKLQRLPDTPRALPLGDLGGPISSSDWQRWHALALATLAADLVGTMEGALAAAVTYSGERVQFETHIGAFQAIQHLCAEAEVLVEASRSATWYAAWAVDNRSPSEALEAARVAKAFAAESAVEVAQTVVQVHGGIAITWETLPHVFLRRALLSRQCLGDERRQLEQLASHGFGDS